jgi:hypothetical protein
MAPVTYLNGCVLLSLAFQSFVSTIAGRLLGLW